MFRQWGLKKQFATVFLVLITLPTMFFGALIYYQTTKAFKQQAADHTIGRLETSEETLTSVIRNVENMTSFMIYDENFRTFFSSSKSEMTSEVYKRAEEGIKGYFTFQLTSFDYIDSIMLESASGNKLHFGNPVTADEAVLDQAATKKGGGLSWSGSYQVDSDWEGKKQVISLSREINDLNHITEPIGRVRIRLDQADLYQTVKGDTAGGQGYFFVMTDQGDVVLHPDENMVGKPFPDQTLIDRIIASSQRSISYETKDNRYLVVKKKIDGMNWFSVAVVNQGEVVQELYNVRSLLVDMILLLLLLGTVAFAGFYFFNIRRILELTEQTKQLENGDFNANVPVNTNDEIGKLGMRFNQMVKTIQTYINQEYKLKIKQKESELQAMQNQIDPHFLYNTLDMIRWTARLENAMETGHLIEQLSKMFRMNLNKGNMWVKLDEEFAYIRHYLELQKSRMGSRLRYSIFYEADIGGAYSIKQILQPLVENSIRHGFKNVSYQGELRIRGYRQENQILIDVVDNGAGFQSYDETGNEGSGFALNQLHERLLLAFGEEGKIKQIPSRNGTWMQVKLPLLNKRPEQKIKKEPGDWNDV
ncbi:HAMP domain-containing protein [Sediminibacillus dalangtanensis]|uniref:HAMP domain-containing protein n=1 Tax=Sediminibacillus dalangtanensis TaxID=2729421 RepID=A0ABX7VQC2_9BACI|nr:sensor histidine kinase [Sediminibacillus dalangtanensis]QTM99142.1 HAMP domain-containing protein [Sediminibacillus dalangtanensis]